jgi:hypothetical protein
MKDHDQRKDVLMVMGFAFGIAAEKGKKGGSQTRRNSQLRQR